MGNLCNSNDVVMYAHQHVRVDSECRFHFFAKLSMQASYQTLEFLPFLLRKSGARSGHLMHSLSVPLVYPSPCFPLVIKGRCNLHSSVGRTAANQLRVFVFF